MREAEDQLKVIPQFCFPDAKDWAPVENFPRSVRVCRLPQHFEEPLKKKVKPNRHTGISLESCNNSAVANNHLLVKKLQAQNGNDLEACKDDYSLFNAKALTKTNDYRERWWI